MSWTLYLGAIVFFSLVFTVFYGVAWSVAMGIRDNYLRHYQKAELQWTEPGRRLQPSRARPLWFLGAGAATAWAVVSWVA